jgi:hypothetical protein
MEDEESASQILKKNNGPGIFDAGHLLCSYDSARDAVRQGFQAAFRLLK